MNNFKLYLMRHGQAEESVTGSDLARELTDYGKIQAKKSGEFLSKYQIDKLIISYAKRTTQTVYIVKECLGNMVEEDLVEYLYNSSDENILMDMLSAQDNKYRNILVVGHNPVIYRLSIGLVSQNSEDIDRLIDSGMPTGQVVALDVQINSWENLSYNSAKLIDIFNPI